jgi:hypothetical protein
VRDGLAILYGSPAAVFFFGINLVLAEGAAEALTTFIFGVAALVGASGAGLLNGFFMVLLGRGIVLINVRYLRAYYRLNWL